MKKKIKLFFFSQCVFISKYIKRERGSERERKVFDKLYLIFYPSSKLKMMKQNEHQKNEELKI